MPGIAVLEFLAVRLGLVMGIAHGHVSPVWPATGIAIAVLLRFGVNLWPGVVVGSFLGLAHTGVGIPVMMGESAAGLLEAVAVVWLVRRWIGTSDPFCKTRDVIRLLHHCRRGSNSGQCDPWGEQPLLGRCRPMETVRIPLGHMVAW